PAADADGLRLLEVGLAGNVLLGILEIRLHRAHRQPDEVPDPIEALPVPGMRSHLALAQVHLEQVDPRQVHAEDLEGIQRIAAELEGSARATAPRLPVDELQAV